MRQELLSNILEILMLLNFEVQSNFSECNTLLLYLTVLITYQQQVETPKCKWEAVKFFPFQSLIELARKSEHTKLTKVESFRFTEFAIEIVSTLQCSIGVPQKDLPLEDL